MTVGFSGFDVCCVGFAKWVLEFLRRELLSGFRVQSLAFRVWGLGFRVLGYAKKLDIVLANRSE